MMRARKTMNLPFAIAIATATVGTVNAIGRIEQKNAWTSYWGSTRLAKKPTIDGPKKKLRKPKRTKRMDTTLFPTQREDDDAGDPSGRKTDRFSLSSSDTTGTTPDHLIDPSRATSTTYGVPFGPATP